MTKKKMMIRYLEKKFTENSGVFFEHVAELLLMTKEERKAVLEPFILEQKAIAEADLAGIDSKYAAEKQAAQEKLQLEKTVLEAMLAP